MESPRAGTSRHVPRTLYNQRGSACPQLHSWSKRPTGQSIQDQDAGLKGPQRRVLSRVHTYQSQLGPAQGGARAPHVGRRDHGYIPASATTPGALDRAGTWRASEGLPGVRYKIIRGALDTPGCATASRPAAATAPRRRANARKGPAERRELVPDPIYKSVLVTQVTTRS